MYLRASSTCSPVVTTMSPAKRYSVPEMLGRMGDDSIRMVTRLPTAEVSSHAACTTAFIDSGACDAVGAAARQHGRPHLRVRKLEARDGEQDLADGDDEILRHLPENVDLRASHSLRRRWAQQPCCRRCPGTAGPARREQSCSAQSIRTVRPLSS